MFHCYILFRLFVHVFFISFFISFHFAYISIHPDPSPSFLSISGNYHNDVWHLGHLGCFCGAAVCRTPFFV